MAVPTVTLTGKFLQQNGSPASGRVIFELVTAMVDANDNVIVPAGSTTVTLDKTGSFSVTLVPSDGAGLAPSPVPYRVFERVGGERVYSVTVPSTPSTSDLADLAPAGPDPTVPSAYQLLAQKGAVDGYASLGSDGLVPTAQLPAGLGGGVTTFNTRAGVVTLTKADVTGTGLAAADVGADASGAATAAVAAEATTRAAADATLQPLDSDLTAIAALDSSTAGAIGSDGAGWIKKTYAQVKTALGITTSDVSGLGTAASANTGTTSGTIPLLSTGGVLPIARLATGTPDGTKFVRDDGTLVVPSGTSVTTSTQAGATYTLALTDAASVVEFTNASAVAVTVPPNSSVAFAVGTIINLFAAGAGGLSAPTAGAGVTIRNNATAVSQYGEISLRYRGSDIWVRVG